MFGGYGGPLGFGAGVGPKGIHGPAGPCIPSVSRAPLGARPLGLVGAQGGITQDAGCISRPWVHIFLRAESTTFVPLKLHSALAHSSRRLAFACLEFPNVSFEAPGGPTVPFVDALYQNTILITCLSYFYCTP